MRKRDRIKELERKVENLETTIDILQRMCSVPSIDARIERALNDRVRVMVVENLDNYKKGKEIKGDIKHIMEVLK